MAAAVAVGALGCAHDRPDTSQPSVSGHPTAEPAALIDGQRTPARIENLTCGVSSGLELVPGGIGALRVGRSEAEVRRECQVASDTTDLDDEGLPERVLVVRTSRGNAEAVLDSGRVWRVSTSVPTLRTADSLGVGSSLADLLRRPGARGIEGEAGLFVIPSGTCGLSFHLAYAVPDDAHRDEWTAADLARVPGATRVDQVLAVACAREP